jgi:DNA-binding transcriptional LysR family regulator
MAVQPSLDLLASFVAVAEELHYTRAARRLHLAQPALSKRIQQLEQAVGATLFSRTPRAVQLTAAGELLLDKARRVLRAGDDFGRAARQLHDGTIGRLRIGFSPSAPHHVLPALMRTFRRRHRGIDCELTEIASDVQIQQILDGVIDVGLLRPPASIPAALACTVFLEEPFVAVVPRDHRLAGRKTLRLSDLATDPVIVMPRRLAAAVHDQVVAACASAGFTPMLREATHVHGVVALVAAGCGVSILPRSAAQVGVRDTVCRPLRGTAIRTVMAVAHLSDGALPPALAFAAVARQLPPSSPRQPTPSTLDS